MRHFESETRLIGAIYGPIWEGSECSKPVSIGERQVAFGNGRHADPAAVEFARAAVSCGDFQHCHLTADSRFLVVRRVITTDRDERIVTVRERTRYVPVTRFPSIAEFVGETDSEEFEESH